MKNLNFNQLKSVKTPESWIENALNIPKKNKKPIYLKPSIIASAACFIVCCALSFAIFANVGTDTKVPLYPAVKVTSVADATNNSENYENINPINSQDSTTATSENIQPIFDNPFEANEILPAPSGTQSHTVNPSNNIIHTSPESGITTENNNIKPESAPTKPSATEPSESTTQTPTQKPTQKPSSDPTEPTEATFVIPTESETPPPTAAPTFTEPITERPTIVGGTEPDIPDSVFSSSIFFIASENSVFNRYQNLYCHIEKADGTSYSEYYSYTEMVFTKSDFNNIWYANFTPKNKSLMLEKGTYYITFYDKNGNSVTRSFYLGNSSVHFYE